MAKALNKNVILEKTGTSKGTINICNKSGKQIFLIPFYFPNHNNYQSTFMVEPKLAQPIKVNGVIQVTSKYSLGGVDSRGQINILFRTRPSGESVKWASGETFFTYAELSEKTNRYLGINKDGHVILVNEAGEPLEERTKPNAADTQNESDQRSLKEEVLILRKAVRDIRQILDELQKSLPRV